jgi:hypothetical protein
MKYKLTPAMLVPLVCSAAPHRRADVGGLLTQVNRKPVEERQQLLLENAKKEGGLTLYTATTSAILRTGSPDSTNIVL